MSRMPENKIFQKYRNFPDSTNHVYSYQRQSVLFYDDFACLWHRPRKFIVLILENLINERILGNVCRQIEQRRLDGSNNFYNNL